MSCVMMIMPTCSSRHSFFSSSRICAWMETSSAVVGSSAMMTSGSQHSASAITTRCRMPPENWWGYCFTRSSGWSMPTCTSSCTARVLASACVRFRWTCMVSTNWLSTVCSGSSEVSGSWKIMPMRRPRTLRFCAGVSVSMRSPFSSTDPPAKRPGASSKPITALPMVDLPAPDSPTTPRISPFSRASDTPSTATSVPRRLGNSMRMSSMFNRAMTSSAQLGVERVAQPVAQQVDR
ncbi:hypothetical protein D3C85_783420 [compost metagenome]